MRTVWIAAIVAVVVLAGAPGGYAHGAVVLNELMPDPASDWSPSDGDEEYDSLDDEWLEIYNAGSEPVDITGWRLRDAVSDSSWRFGFTGILEAGEFFVVYGNESYQWEDENGYAKNGLSMNNSGDTMVLVEADLTTVVDEVTYSSQDIGDDRAYGRVPDGGPDWVCIDGLNPTNPPSTGLLPTPGMPNTGAPVAAMTWAIMKAMFH